MRSLVMTVMTAVFVSAASADAQTTGGSIRGHVQDEQGAVLPGATVTAVSPDVAGTYTALTGPDGVYRLLDLPPGVYSVSADLQGFARFVRDNIVIRAG